MTPWTADSGIVTADSSLYTASGYEITTQFPNVPALPGVPMLARQQTAAIVSAGATTSGQTLSLAAQLGLPPTATFGLSFDPDLTLQPL